MRANYAASLKQFGVLVSDMDSSATTNGIEHHCKVDNQSECSYTCRYSVYEESTDVALAKNDLFQMCLNLVKKIQNVNCEDKFYALATSRVPSRDNLDQQNSSKE